MVDLTSAAVTTLIGMLGVVVGAIVSNYVNQRVAARTARKDLFFKKKVEYFDRVVGVIEHNIKLYTLWRKKLEVSYRPSEVKRALSALKKERAKFDVSTSSLYVYVDAFSRDIKRFVALEKQIFVIMERLTSDNYGHGLDSLRERIHELQRVGRTIIATMRAELLRE
jgi:hypothetical protein